MQLCRFILASARCISINVTHGVIRPIWALTRENLFGGLQTTKVQTSLCICAAPLLFAFWKVSCLNLLQAHIGLINFNGQMFCVNWIYDLSALWFHSHFRHHSIVLNILTIFILDTSKQVLWQTVKTQMKCCIRPYSIGVCTVCFR